MEIPKEITGDCLAPASLHAQKSLDEPILCSPPNCCVQEDGEGDEEEGLDQLRGHGRIQRLLVYSTCFSKQSFSMVLCLL